jgi:hypothetical protein
VIKHADPVRGPVALSAVPVLREAVESAQLELLMGPFDEMTVNRVLIDLSTALQPVREQLVGMSESHPGGPVATVLAHLGTVYTRAAADQTGAAIAGVITAAAAVRGL